MAETTQAPDTESPREAEKVSAPSKRPTPWSVLAIAAGLAVFCGWIFYALVIALPPASKPKPARGPILGLDDEATKRADAELHEKFVLGASASVSTGAPSSSTSPTASTVQPSSAPAVPSQ